MRTAVALATLMAFTSDPISAAYFRDGGFLSENGILESMRIEPELPAPGEGFTVKLSGSWAEVNPDGVCRAPLEVSEVIVYPEVFVQIVSLPEQDASYCDKPPASWNLDVDIPASAWAAVDENGFLLIEHNLFSGINMLTGIDQVFDMRLGTHTVPAFIDSGFWVSADLPLEGILVEQQGSRVLFYGLGYDRNIEQGDEGEPVWQLVAGEMYGDSTLGRSYRYDWPFDENNIPLEAPTEMEVLTANDSGAIIVDDVNHIRVFTGVKGNRGLYNSYNRVAFGLDKGRLPNYVPPLDGRWNLHGFDEQDTAFSTTLELLDGRPQDANEYHFPSADGKWLATCKVIAPGTGDCSIEHASNGVKLDFPMTAFQGNLARGSLVTGSGDTFEGVLVRDPWRLPVLDSQ